jgi:hypothetical protein
MTRIGTAAALIALIAVPVTAQSTRTYSARLSPVPIDVPMQATIAGTGSVTATLSGSRLTIDGKFEGLRTNATVARLHVGRKGIRGPAAHDLTVTPAVKGTVTGIVDLSPQQMAALQQGGLYVQIHSEKAPDGNLWGWLLTPEKR